MILPREDIESSLPASSIREPVDAFFCPGGHLERACRTSEFPFEHRPQQRLMAGAVADAIERKRHMAVEAGTGVGKSFAYLVPLILSALEQNVQVVVSTYTISLQEQLMYKDIPFLQKHLGRPFKAAMVKGRTNYLCLRRLARSRRMEGDLFQGRQVKELEAIEKWATQTKEGSIQDLPEQPSSEVWSSVCAEHGNCLWQKCPEYHACFFMKARAEINDANVLIVNHHLLFSDLALRTAGASFLPDYELLVIDEAHQVEGVASEHLGIRLSQYAFEHWLRRLFVPESNKGLLSYIRKPEPVRQVTQLWDDVSALFIEIGDWANFGPGNTQRVIPEPLTLHSTVPIQIDRLVRTLKDLAEEIHDDELLAEWMSVTRRGEEIKNSLYAFLGQTCEDAIYWVEQQGERRRQIVLYGAPIEVAPALQEILFKNIPTVVMTSATLSVNGEMKYFKKRVGADDCDDASVGSPFDYARQMRVIIPKNMPDPNDAAAFVPACAKAIVKYTRRSKGRAFVLFTSDRMMRQVADLVRDEVERFGFNLLVQGEGLPRHQMLEQFKKNTGSILFGLDSFWMGVDVPGDALSNVIITRLPFSVPDQPLVKARMDRIKERGGDPFREYSIPEAVLKFRQGVGRLIRTASDEGTVVILDQRIISKRYGRTFLQSIPECPVEIVDDSERII